jgi:hypothetical protein
VSTSPALADHLNCRLTYECVSREFYKAYINADGAIEAGNWYESEAFIQEYYCATHDVKLDVEV